MRILLVPILASLALTGCETIQDTFGMGESKSIDAATDPIASAMSAGPLSLAENATITDLEGNVLREGTNGWTCVPDDLNAANANPWCFNAPWGNFRAAMGSATNPSFDRVGLAYMLAGDAPVSNIDPTATEATPDNDWVEDAGVHLMLIVPGDNPYEGFSSEPYNGGPWIMFPGTAYEHLMIPIESMEE